MSVITTAKVKTGTRPFDILEVNRKDGTITVVLSVETARRIAEILTNRVVQTLFESCTAITWACAGSLMRCATWALGQGNMDSLKSPKGAWIPEFAVDDRGIEIELATGKVVEHEDE
jgi:hypothetical protein